MLKEHNIKSFEESELLLIKDDILTTLVIEGGGGVTVAEVLVLTLMNRDKDIPQNIADAAVKNVFHDDQKWIITKVIKDWNKSNGNAEMRFFMKDVSYQSIAGAMAMASSSDINIYQYTHLKLENLQTALDVLAREF